MKVTARGLLYSITSKIISEWFDECPIWVNTTLDLKKKKKICIFRVALVITAETLNNIESSENTSLSYEDLGARNIALSQYNRRLSRYMDLHCKDDKTVVRPCYLFKMRVTILARRHLLNWYAPPRYLSYGQLIALHSILFHRIIYSCHRYLLLAPKSSYDKCWCYLYGECE